MNWLMTFGVYLYIACIALIAIIGVVTLGIVSYIGITAAYERYRERKCRAMATPMDIDELQLRRLKKSVAVRIAQRKAAN